MKKSQTSKPKLFDRVILSKGDPQQNVAEGMTGTLMELGKDGTWGVIELDDDAVSRSGRYSVSLPLIELEVMPAPITV